MPFLNSRGINSGFRRLEAAKWGVRLSPRSFPRFQVRILTLMSVSPVLYRHTVVSNGALFPRLSRALFCLPISSQQGCT